MGETRHTPGPWVARGADVLDAEGGLVVSLTNSWKRDKVSRQRDLHDPFLIASAPAMRDACAAAEDFVATIDSDAARAIYAQLHAALALTTPATASL